MTQTRTIFLSEQCRERMKVNMDVHAIARSPCPPSPLASGNDHHNSKSVFFLGVLYAHTLAGSKISARARNRRRQAYKASCILLAAAASTAPAQSTPTFAQQRED